MCFVYFTPPPPNLPTPIRTSTSDEQQHPKPTLKSSAPFGRMETANIPVIDIGGGRDEREVARELVDAAVEFGFIYVKGGHVRAERAFELVSFRPFFSSRFIILSPCGGISRRLLDFFSTVKGLDWGVSGWLWRERRERRELMEED